MLLIVAGAGASFDSVPSRPVGASSLEDARLPLADALFDARGEFEEIQREIPQVMQIAPQLLLRRNSQSVEDVLEVFAAQADVNAHRLVQLAAVKFYLQGVIARCEERWYRTRRVPTNMMTLLDQVENARRGRSHPLFVTFNYDRLIEDALANRGYSVESLDDLVRTDRPNLIKLHGSVDWARPVAEFNIHEFGGPPWRIASQISERINTFGEPGDIVRAGPAPTSRWKDALAIPAIAIPVKNKDHFECPPSHVAKLQSQLKAVRTVLTIGWKGAEHHFLSMLREHALQGLEVICVAGTAADADATIASLRQVLHRAQFESFGWGFTEFVRQGKLERLLNITWV